MRSLVPSLLFVAFVTGAALKSQDFTDNYDNPPTPPTVPVLSQVGTNEKGALDYNGYGYVDLSLTAGLLLKPASGKYVIGSGVTSVITQGTRSFKVKNGFKSFTPKTIYTACILYDAAGRTPLPKKCTLRFTGQKYNSPSGASVSQDFTFDPKLALPNNFAKQTFDKNFKDVTSVTVTFVPETDALLLVQDLDSFSYTATS